MTMMNRRDLCVVLAGFAAMAGAAEGQTAAPPVAGEDVLVASKAFPFDSLPVKKNDNGNETRAVTKGALPTGEAVELHETTLMPGLMPHPAHMHRHSEFMMVREGTLEFDMNGTKQRVGPGGVMFAASGVLHGLKNVGSTPANYFVIAIGRELPKQLA